MTLAVCSARTATDLAANSRARSVVLIVFDLKRTVRWLFKLNICYDIIRILYYTRRIFHNIISKRLGHVDLFGSYITLWFDTLYTSAVTTGPCESFASTVTCNVIPTYSFKGIPIAAGMISLGIRCFQECSIDVLWKFKLYKTVTQRPIFYFFCT